MPKVTAIIEVTRSGYLDIDGHQYTPEKLVLDGFVDLYPIKDFRFKVKAWCWKVTEQQVENAVRLLHALGYKTI